MSEENQSEKSRYKQGQLLNFVNVRFPGNARSFSFFIGNRKFSYGQKVMAMSDRGMAVGYINSFIYQLPFKEDMLPLQSINKIATEADLEEQKQHYQKQKRTETICNDLIAQYNLEMNLTHVEFTQFGKKAVFYFTAPARVDFRQLVKDLVQNLKMRIELRQISVRDRAASVGGIGPCGLQLCCSSFLKQYGNVGVKMAKNQDLTLNFSKLNGVCGQLKCCLQYEDQVYTHKRKKLPEMGQLIAVKNGDRGRVINLLPLIEQFDLLTLKGIKRRYTADQYQAKNKTDSFEMPKSFEHVSDETSIIIGLDETKEREESAKREEIQAIENSSVGYGAEVFKELFGEETLATDH